MQASSHRLHALVIGVGEYLHSPFSNLPVSMADAREITTILCDPNLCGYPTDQVTVLVGERASLPGVRKAFQHLAKVCEPDDTVVIYFSGHGGRTLLHDQRRVFLCLRDSDPYDLASTALSELELTSAIRFIKAERLLVILDSCFASGGAQVKSATTSGLWEPRFPAEFFDAFSTGSGRVIMASSREDQVSIARRQGDLSLFTYHLGQALRGKATRRGDGFIRVLDVFKYVSEAVKRENPEQTPILKADNVDGNFAIALNSGAAPQSSTADEAQTEARAGVGPGILIERLNTVYNQNISSDGITINFNDYHAPHEKTDD